MKCVQEIHITKPNKRGWSIRSLVWWDNQKFYNRTNSGADTLASALWKTIKTHWNDVEYMITNITVKGKPITNLKAYQIIEKDLRNTGLSYAIPMYKKALEV